MSMGQTDGQIMIRRLIPIIEAEWAKVSKQPSNTLFSYAIAQEIRAMNHETLYSRLFMS
jgi:urease accessory protein